MIENKVDKYLCNESILHGFRSPHIEQLAKKACEDLWYEKERVYAYIVQLLEEVGATTVQRKVDQILSSDYIKYGMNDDYR